jgi:hypothetical protein
VYEQTEPATDVTVANALTIALPGGVQSDGYNPDAIYDSAAASGLTFVKTSDLMGETFHIVGAAVEPDYKDDEKTQAVFTLILAKDVANAIARGVSPDDQVECPRMTWTSKSTGMQSYANRLAQADHYDPDGRAVTHLELTAQFPMTLCEEVMNPKRAAWFASKGLNTPLVFRRATEDALTLARTQRQTRLNKIVADLQAASAAAGGTGQ